jgi:hypothetical protein
MEWRDAMNYIEQHTSSKASTPRSGVYILQPKFCIDTGRPKLYKFGETLSLRARAGGEYSRDWPPVAGSFNIVAFLIVGKVFTKARESKLLQNSMPGFGFVKPVSKNYTGLANLEWREHISERPVMSDIKSLFDSIRKSVDGKLFLFSNGGARTFYRDSEVDVDIVRETPPHPRVHTRATAAKGPRQIGGIELDFARGTDYVHAQGGRLFRSIRKPIYNETSLRAQKAVESRFHRK